MARASSFSSPCWGSANSTEIRLGSRRTPLGEVGKLLVEERCRGFDQELGLSDPLLPQIRDQVGDFAPALDLIETVVAGGELLKTGNQSVAQGQSVGSDVVENARSQDLLGAAAADAEKKLEGSAIAARSKKGAWLASACFVISLTRLSLCRIAATFAQFLRRICRIAATRRAAGDAAVRIGSEGFDKGSDVGDINDAGLQQLLGTVQQSHDGRGRDAPGVEVGWIVYVACGKGPLNARDQLLRGGRVVGKKGHDGCQMTEMLRLARDRATN